VNWLPFGGFVKLFGEELSESKRVKEQESRKAFWRKSKKVRTGVIVAGVLANFLLAVVVFSVVYSFSGIPTQTGQIKIVGLLPDSPASKAGLKEGDVILKVDEEHLNDLNHFIKLVDQKKGAKIELLVEREKGKLVLWVTPRENPPEGEGPLGVIVSDIEMKKYPFWQMPFRGTVEGFKEAFGWTVVITQALGKMVVDLITQGVAPKDIAGPVGIFQITGMVAKSGVLATLQFIGILSVNLAIINILPFPALDGGRLIFVAYEAVARRRPRPSFERWVNTAGMVFLLFLIFLVTINDIIRILGAANFASWLRKLLPF
jgi:regulator of sigma E protease